jgi:hypothetical protein
MPWPPSGWMACLSQGHQWYIRLELIMALQSNKSYSTLTMMDWCVFISGRDMENIIVCLSLEGMASDPWTPRIDYKWRVQFHSLGLESDQRQGQCPVFSAAAGCNHWKVTGLPPNQVNLMPMSLDLIENVLDQSFSPVLLLSVRRQHNIFRFVDVRKSTILKIWWQGPKKLLCWNKIPDSRRIWGNFLSNFQVTLQSIILKYLGIPNYYFKGKMHLPRSECRGSW